MKPYLTASELDTKNSNDTVFILGAGFSKDAGIPLLGNFVDKMWELSIRRKAVTPLSEADKNTFAAAMRIREELDGYHGRAAFNDRNIEDLLSILSFNVIGGDKRDRDKLRTMSLAIARTIELTCTVRHPGINFSKSSVVEEGPSVYRNFWKALFNAQNNNINIPTIITFNYDLVLERSLLQVLIGTQYGISNKLPFDRFALEYHYPPFPSTPFDIRYVNFEKWDRRPTLTEGTIIDKHNTAITRRTQPIEILKLHGSLNFPRKMIESPIEQQGKSLIEPTNEPYILPPIFNKSAGNTTSQMWKTAIERIRSAKNIVIVGYSLPATDIYMQYFLKAGVGPNRDLNKIVVFDPILFFENSASDAMKLRYANCFAPQLRDRITFQPSGQLHNISPGTTEAFVEILTNQPSALLF